MNFVLAAGGTGGHMVPAHALAAELKSRGHGVLLITDERGARFPGLFDDVPVHILPAGRLGGGPIGWLKAAALGARAAAARPSACYREHRPDAVVGFGGYPAFPALLAARGDAHPDRAPRAECGARPGQPAARRRGRRRSPPPMTRSSG